MSAPDVLSAAPGRRPPVVAHHFASFEQQREAASLGVWVFLVTEVMFFGALFASYTIYRWSYPAAFAASSRRLDIELGTINTAILLTSSLSMALAVRAAQLGRGKITSLLLGLTVALGVAFLAIKGHEYQMKFEEHLVPGPGFHMEVADARGAQLFFFLYFAMTGLHAIHMIVGVGLLTGMLIPAYMGKFSPENHNFVEGSGLYWHFVDIIWIFLYPLLYLVGRHG